MENIGNLGHFVSWWSKSKVAGKKEAVVFLDEDRIVSYSELNENVNKLSNALQGIGVKKGDQVGCLLRNCVEFIEIILACAKIGARLVPLNIRLVANELEYIINDSKVKILFTETFFDETLGPLKELISVDKIIYADKQEYTQLLQKASGTEPLLQANWYDDFSIMYTSGTTGKPKGAVQRQINWWANSDHFNTTFGLSRKEKLLSSISLTSNAAYCTLFPILLVGGTIYLTRGFNAEETLKLIEKYKISWISLVSTMLRLIANEPYFQEADLSSLRLGMVGAEAVPSSLLDIFSKKTKGAIFTGGYGLTEGGGLNATLLQEDALEKPGAYLPCMWNRIRVVDEEGKDVEPGKTGEIIIKGLGVMREYWGKPEATRDTIKDGWLFTGDLAEIDADGYFYVVGRKKEMIISGGANVYPAEIEEIICRHSAVAEAAVVGLPHPIWGEGVTAAVILRPGEKVTESDIIKHCRGKIADYKVPKAVIFEDQFPRSNGEKTEKKDIREKYLDFYTKKAEV